MPFGVCPTTSCVHSNLPFTWCYFAHFWAENSQTFWSCQDCFIGAFGDGDITFCRSRFHSVSSDICMLQPFCFACLFVNTHMHWTKKTRILSSAIRARSGKKSNIEISALFDVKIKLQRWKFNKLPSTRHTEALLKKISLSFWCVNNMQWTYERINGMAVGRRCEGQLIYWVLTWSEYSVFFFFWAKKALLLA